MVCEGLGRDVGFGDAGWEREGRELFTLGEGGGGCGGHRGGDIVVGVIGVVLGWFWAGSYEDLSLLDLGSFV